MVVSARQKIKDEENLQKVKDDQKNAILTGFYSALFSRQRKIKFPMQMIDEIYKEDDDNSKRITIEEIQRRTALLKDRLRRRDKSNDRE